MKNIAYMYPSAEGDTTEVVSFTEAIKRQKAIALTVGHEYASIEDIKHDLFAYPTVSFTDLAEGTYVTPYPLA